LANALRTFCLDKTDADLLMAGKLELSFVEKVRVEAAAKQVWRSTAGRTIEAMSTCGDPSIRGDVVDVDVCEAPRRL
jgi:hypothetical protein